MEYGYTTNEGNPGIAKTYINGAPIQSKTINDTIWVEQEKNIYIGANENGNANWFKGSMQNIRLYNTAMNDSEVSSMYSAAGSESGAVVISTNTLVPFNARSRPHDSAHPHRYRECLCPELVRIRIAQWTYH